MKLNHLELSYSPEQDRLILRIGTTTDEVIQLFFTRRFIFVFWPVLQQAIGALESEYISEAASDKSKSKLSRSEEHTSELQSRRNLVCRLLLEKKNFFVRHLLWSLIIPV